MLKAFNKAARWAFKEKKTKITPNDLTDKNVQPLMNEINGILQEALQKGIAHEIPEAMKQHLVENVYVFSGCKTYAELREISDLLQDENGAIKPFSKFFKDVRKVHNEYNKAYLESEYQFAEQSAIMASKWTDYEQEGDRYNLQYRTAKDDHVRESHQLLHDTTLPQEDPFWIKYFPPNGWRCRCNVVQVRKNRYPESDGSISMERGEEATRTIGAGGVNTSEMFRFNPGKQKIIFPAHHPYMKELNANEQKRLIKYFAENKTGDFTITDSPEKLERDKYLAEMQPLLEKKVKQEIDGQEIHVGFTTKGNKHLYADSQTRAKDVLEKEDLKRLDKALQKATYVKTSELYKERKDKISKFYYFKDAEKEMYYNVAEIQFKRDNGKINYKRFLYSITDVVK